MAESIATRALRGLGNALRLNGERDAPPGIELAIPAQTVFDLTTVMQYGSALQFGHFEDGWVTANLRVVIVATTTSVATTVIWDTDVSGDFGIVQNVLNKTLFWIYGVSLRATASAQVSDLGVAHVNIRISAAIDLNASSGSRQSPDIFQASGDNLVLRSPLIASYVPEVSAYKLPIPWAAGQSATFTNQNKAGVGTVTYEWSILGRILPLGIPPLP